MINKNLENYLDINSISFKKDVSLSKISYFKTGGVVKLVVYPDSINSLKDIVNFARANNIKFEIFGKTTNCLFLDSFVANLFIFTKHINNIMIEDEKYLIAECGAYLPTVAKTVSMSGYTGFEGLVGIPGSIGASVLMNAGSYGNEVFDNLISVDILDNYGNIKTVYKKDIDFSFRNTQFKIDSSIVLSTKFSLVKGNLSSIKNKIKNVSVNRRDTQEHVLPNLGSLFATRDIYSDIAQVNVIYKVILYLIRKTYRFKKEINNKFLNKLTCKFFDIDFESQPFSDKTMNCIVNRGKGCEEVYKYILDLKSINPEMKLENEIIGILNAD
ncbi:FAD-binding protein [Sulfurimonas sp.]|uniref:FAD-binding protein n=1 Tax=Sulfurimonas sp. TaxID=2022749 RepID=UPI00262E4DF4|nr:FAD-binding protein [Sulfurimonas sp.]MCW8895344.1 FAD-binding protein [Sulfurimonas sp.]